jgi:hypothetical protein
MLVEPMDNLHQKEEEKEVVFEISHYFLREIMALMVTYTGQSYKLY